VPRVSKSNETEHAGRITKRGSKLGRTALVQCALIAQRYSPYLKRRYEKIKARWGTGKAIIENSWGSFTERLETSGCSRIFRTSCWRRLEVERTRFLMPRQKRAVRYAGRCPAPRQGDTPGPLSLLPYVPERSSPSRVSLRRAKCARP